MTTTTFFAPIVGKTANDDGTLTVYGKLTGPDVDGDGQICDPAWLKTAVPDWFEIGNIREMHQPIAAGKATALEQDGDDYYISAKIVDPGSIKKVEHEVLTGFSIGIKSPKLRPDPNAPNGRIIGGRIVESSLADRACNDTCKLILAKVDGAELAHVEEFVGKDDGDLGGSVETEGEVDAGGAGDTADDPPEGDPPGDVELEAPDPADDVEEVNLLGQILAGIELIQANVTALLADEVEELSTGGGTGPVRVALYLLDDLAMLLSDVAWFEECDDVDDLRQLANEIGLNKGEAMKPIDMLTKAVSIGSADDATDEDKAKLADVRKALGLDALQSTVDNLTEGKTKAATSEELEELEGRLAKVEELAAPGGPALAAPPSPTDDTAAAITKAEHFEKLADTVTEPALRESYRASAAELRKSTTTT